MKETNFTIIVEFSLSGLTDRPDLRFILFPIFLAIYLFTLLGNSLLFITIKVDVRLHTPMYFFLSNLSFLDICYTSVTVPKMLETFLFDKTTISFSNCVTQMFCYLTLVATEVLLLAVMAYDRYVAICFPLRYQLIMSRKVCIQLAVAMWSMGFLDSVLHTTLTFQLPFCGSLKIDHYFCDIPPLLKLACVDTSVNQLVLMLAGCAMSLGSFLLTLISYTLIIATIVRMRSSEGKHKAFSTCASHLFTVTLFFGTIFFMYLRPSTSYTMKRDRVVSVFYTIIIPMLNPIIYSFRNKDVKGAMKKLLQTCLGLT
ncbi:olfactory receptor 1044-like [Rhinatrema bivittatum]|uniref:olfactory receptor 1044-like n=1 Tax=Rhinatrema bivittatum TaxID=194408 RepID=UPI001127C95A|nr:olfactory receptor 1044-like [Rhinatrema bivittatum]